MTEDYLSFFNTLPHATVYDYLVYFAIGLLRIGPIVALAPFLGSKSIPTQARVGIAISLVVIFLPAIFSNMSPGATEGLNLTVIAVKELVIGFILGFYITIPFYIATSVGIIIDYLRGASIMQSQDPNLQIQASPIGILYNYLLIALFFQIGGPLYFFGGVLESYHVIPADSFFNAKLFLHDATFWQKSMDLVNHLMTIALQLAAPSIVAILMAEMFLGIANRLAPQVQIVFLGMSLKSLLGIFMLWAAWFFILKQLNKETMSWLKEIDGIIHHFKQLLK